MSKKYSFLYLLFFLFSTSFIYSNEPIPTFTIKPTAIKNGDKIKIQFTISAYTDVAVFIEDNKGKIIRHLVAGVLGKNPPPPLKAESLSQEIEWDGKANYNKSAEGGPFKVRVALGLGAKYDKSFARKPPNFTGAVDLGVAPDGMVYARSTTGVLYFNHPQLFTLNRDGSYGRTLIPFPATTDNSEARGHNVVNINGVLLPKFLNEKGYLPHMGGGHGSGNIAISHDNKNIYFPVTTGILRLNTAGGTEGELIVPINNADSNKEEPKLTFIANTPPAIALSSDSSKLFIAKVNQADFPTGKGTAIYKLDAISRKGKTLFFGDPKVPGADQTHLGVNPGGIINDQNGNLLIADTSNNRILVIAEIEGKFVCEFKIDKPILVGTFHKANTLYVLSLAQGNTLRLTKFSKPNKSSLWSESKEICHMVLPLRRTELTQSMVVDNSTEIPVIWATAFFYGDLCRIEDHGDKFQVTELPYDKTISSKTDEIYIGLEVDRNTKEVYARNGGAGSLWERFNEETGNSELINIPYRSGGGSGPSLIPHPNGNLYGLQWPFTFFQLDRNAKLLPFSEPRLPTEMEMKLNFPTRFKSFNNDISLWKHNGIGFSSVAMTEMPHSMTARWSDGHIFILEQHLFSPDRVTPNESGCRTYKAMHEYLPSGKRITTPTNPIIWKMTDAASGPKFDAAGNIYIVDIVRPSGWAFPSEFESIAGKPKPGQVLDGYANVLAENYGGVVKFSPKGGTIHYGEDESYLGKALPNPFDGELKLDKNLKSIDASLYFRALSSVKITGAEWVHGGIGHVGLYGCNCENVTFDVDEFGRVFFPDLSLFQIRVIDTAGNALTKLGSYGNADNRGPESDVIDPKSGKLRSRQPTDPKNIKSPYAQPEIALAWPIGVAVTDKFVYIGDNVNNRMLRTKFVYATEESCVIK